MGDEVIDKLVQAGVNLVPGGSLAQSIWSAVRPANAAERFDLAKREYDDELAVRLVDTIRAVRAELRAHRTELDQLAPLRALAIAEQVAKSASEASGDSKVEAMLNAGARQFDPRKGPQETRKYWLDRVTQLSDLEVRVLMLLKDHSPLSYREEAYLAWGLKHTKLELPHAEHIALGLVLERLVAEGNLVGTTPTHPSVVERYPSVVLSSQGRTIVNFIEPIGGAGG
jgi:hypothetical protein